MAQSKLRSEKELQTSLLFFAILICMYALLFGIAYGELRERSRLLNIKGAYGDGVHYFSSDEQGLAQAKEYIESLKKREKPQEFAKETHKEV